MTPLLHRCLRLTTCAGLLATAAVLRADEGMWLFSHPPLERIARDHAAALGDARLTPEWLTHLQQASVRFNSGGSGSFVSADGLVLTNHHVGADALQKLGTPDRNLYRDGFFATSREAELRCLLCGVVDQAVNGISNVEPSRAPMAARTNASLITGSPRDVKNSDPVKFRLTCSRPDRTVRRCSSPSAGPATCTPACRRDRRRAPAGCRGSDRR